MKSLITSTFFLALLARAGAQVPPLAAPGTKATRDTTRVFDYTVILTAGVGDVFYHRIPGDMTISFPYTVQPAGTNLIAKETFTGKAKNFYSGDMIPIEFFNMEFLPKNNIGIRTAIGEVSAPAGEKDDAFYFREGVYYSIPIHLGARRNTQWFFRPGLDGFLVITSGGGLLGTIENSNATVGLLGHSSGPQFSTTDDDGNQSGPYNTRYLNIYMDQNRGALIPKLTLAFQSKWLFFASVDAGWLVPVFTARALAVYQEDGNGDDNNLMHVMFKHNPITIAVNNQVVGRTPSVNGLYLALNVGISYPHFEKRRKKCYCGADQFYYDSSPVWTPGGGGGSGGGHSTAPVGPSGGGGGGHHG